MNTNYEAIISNIKPTPNEQQVIQKVKQGIASDQNKSPWDSDKWYRTFTKQNQDGLSFADAPKNTLLMVVTETLGTLYQNNRGTQVMRGSIVVKLEDNLVACLDAFTWGIGPSNSPVIYGKNGFFEVNSSEVFGKVKAIAKVNA